MQLPSYSDRRQRRCSNDLKAAGRADGSEKTTSLPSIALSASRQMFNTFETHGCRTGDKRSEGPSSLLNTVNGQITEKAAVSYQDYGFTLWSPPSLSNAVV